MCKDPCTELSWEAGGNAINDWPLATQNSLSQTSFPSLVAIALDFASYFPVLLPPKCHALVIGLTCCIAHSLLTVDTDIYGGG